MSHVSYDRHLGPPEGNAAMDDEVQRSKGRRSPAKRALLGAATPFIGYFDRRFQDMHEHLDELPALDRLEAILRQELSQTRADVAADTDTIAELSFTLERFADLFTARMEQLASQFAGIARGGGAEHGSSIAELPFAFAAAADLERGAAVATISDDGRLSIGLAALGLHVTMLDPTASVTHPDVAVVDERVDDWAGPGEPVDALFALTPPARLPDADAPTRETLDRFHKWLRPTGLLVLAIRLDPDQGNPREYLDDLLADWDVEREAHFEQDGGGAWRCTAEVPATGVAVLRAAPRA
jgi:hypothetical protein